MRLRIPLARSLVRCVRNSSSERPWRRSGWCPLSLSDLRLWEAARLPVGAAALTDALKFAGAVTILERAA